ncbi:MAG TPA: prolipoprotein diacylglyceryl transferase [Bacillota bacterium]|nr:prolipoprotein diacylglyceryl transferase [Bacillota bacterium]
MNPEFTVLGITIHWYGVIIASAIICGVFLAIRLSRTFKLDPDSIIDFALLSIPMAIVGARVYYIAFKWEYYKSDPISMLYIWEGGLAIYGGVLFGILAGVIFAKWKKISFWNLADLGAPCLILGQAIGRWGNFINQEAYGRAVTNPAWQWFPASVFIRDGLPGDQGWYMATFFYESIWNFAILTFLLFYIRKRKREGEVFLLYLILYSAGRIVIEGFRTDSLYVAGTSIRVSQLLSGILIVLGLALFIYRRYKVKPGQTLDQGQDMTGTIVQKEEIPVKNKDDTQEDGSIDGSDI